MKKYILTLIILLLSGPAYAADFYKMNIYTGKQDIAGQYPANVGIGTSSSATNGQVRSFAGYVGINTIGPFQTVEVNGNVGIGTTTPQGGFVVTNGNVGIGTWAPSEKLFVTGNIGFDDFGRNLYFRDPDLYLTYNKWNTATTLNMSIWNINTGPIVFGVSDAEKMRITSGGNVGIGSASPGQKLDVIGDIRGNGFSGAATGDILCVKANGAIGSCGVAIVGTICTCS